MADKYLKIGTNSYPEEVEATTTSAGAGDAGEIIALDASGRIDSTMMPVGVDEETVTLEATETLTSGNFVNFWLSGGACKARKADSTSALPADGFVLSTFTTGQSAKIYLRGQSNTAVSGLSVGVRHYLGSAGGLTTTAPTTSGYIIQEIGIPTGTTNIPFHPYIPLTRA